MWRFGLDGELKLNPTMNFCVVVEFQGQCECANDQKKKKKNLKISTNINKGISPTVV